MSRIYKNGRQVHLKDFTPEDHAAEDMKIGTDKIIKKHFALWPTMTLQGTVWFKYYWTLAVTKHQLSLHGGVYEETQFATNSLKQMKYEYEENYKPKLYSAEYKAFTGKSL